MLDRYRITQKVICISSAYERRCCYEWHKWQEINMGNLHRWNCDCNNKLFFLPEIIPVHFAGNGAADDFGNKVEIFFMPILLLAVSVSYQSLKRSGL